MKKILLSVIGFYKKHVSPGFVALFGGGCRFTPNCSDYAKGVVERFGAAKAATLIIKRILRCHPLGGFGFDPIPKI